VRAVNKFFENGRVGAHRMNTKQTPRQIDLIAEYGNAHMPVEAIAAALDVHPGDLRAVG
jgi:hypothetical protein